MTLKIEICNGFDVPGDGYMLTANIGEERVTFLRDARDPKKYYELHREKNVGAQWKPIKASRYQLATATFEKAGV